MSHDSNNHLIHAIDRLVKKISELIEKCFHGTHGHCKPRIVRLLVVVRPAEPIKKKDIIMDPIEIGQVPLGMRVPIDFTPDSPVDIKSDGSYASVSVTAGDATAQVALGSTPKSWRIYVNGDGAIGAKSAVVAADGHVGDGDVEIEQTINWEVTSPDATTFDHVVGPAEPIPTPPVPLAAKK